MVDQEGDTGPYPLTERSQDTKISDIRTLAAFLSIIAAQKIANKRDCHTNNICCIYYFAFVVLL